MKSNAMNSRKYLEYAALAVLLLTFYGYFAIRVWDIDFWWHVAAGRNILEHAAIPSTDPFGVYDANNVWGQTILKSQWLGQVLLYSVYRWFDLDGIILFRAGLLTLCLAVIYLRCRLAGANMVFAFTVIALAGMHMLLHTGERPQLFSFLYVSLIFLLFDGFVRSGKRGLLLAVPLLMLFWSNTHGGSVLGMVALGLAGVCFVLGQRFSQGSFTTPQAKLMLVVLCLSMGALLATPNGWTTFQHIIALENNPLRDRTSEYASPWSLWPATRYYWVFVALAVLSLPGFVNKDHWQRGMLALALGLISLTGFRYIPFFVLVAAPYVAASLSRMLVKIKLPGMAASVLVGVAAITLLGYGVSKHRVFQHGIVESRYPVGAVNFIKERQLGGKMFNSMGWGGYLIWHLAGKVTVFVDGRMLDPKRVIPYTHILWASQEGIRYFEEQDFDLALVPYGNTLSGERYPLAPYLFKHPEWQAVYRDNQGYLFARKSLLH
jgi:hypothetical protein